MRNTLYATHQSCPEHFVSDRLSKKVKRKKRKREEKLTKNTEHVAVHYCRFSVFSKNVFLKQNCCI